MGQVQDLIHSHGRPEEKIGFPHRENPYWKMFREGKTRDLAQAFVNGQVDCNTEIIEVSGHTLLHESIILNRREIFQLCEVYGTDWNKPDRRGVTALMKAAATNRTYFIEKLLEVGANPSLKDQRGWTAQDYANYYRCFDSLDVIQEYKHKQDDSGS